MPIEYTPEQKLALFASYDELLHKVLAELHNYEKLTSPQTRETHIQHLITTIEFAFEELKPTVDKTPDSSQNSATIGYGLSRPPVPVVEIPLLKELKTTLLEKIQTKQNDPILLAGGAGAGKSALAILLACDSELQPFFNEGIFWVSLGEHPDVLTAQHRLIRLLTPQDPPEFVDTDEARNYLWERLAARRSLLILDDVWGIEEALAFNMMGAQCQWLITTPNSDLCGFVKHFGKKTDCYDLTPFAPEKAAELFLSAANQTALSPLPKAAQQIIDFCQGIPLALQLAATAAATSGSAPDWQRLWLRLQDTDYEFPGDHPLPLMQTLHLCIEDLGENADYYLTLAVFADYLHIPQSTVYMLWQHMFQLNEKQASALLEDYAKKNLLRLCNDGKNAYFSLHRFQYDYLCDNVEVEKLHQHLLNAYRRQSPQGWLSGPNDGYFVEYLPFHLTRAGRNQELKSLLLDIDWMWRKLNSCSLHELMNDYLLINDLDLEKVYRALFAAMPHLLENKKTLAHELLDRLWEKASKEIQALLNQAKELEPNWLPAFPDMEDVAQR